MTRAKTILLLAFTIGICLTGCKKEAPDKNRRLTIAVIPKGTIHEFWKTVHAGADMAGQELDVDILWKGSLKEDDREAQISVVENIITRGADGIVLAPLDDVALRRPVDEAMRNGIPVVIFDSGLKGDNYISYVATDNFKAGQLAGQRYRDCHFQPVCRSDYGKRVTGSGKSALSIRRSRGKLTHRWHILRNRADCPGDSACVAKFRLCRQGQIHRL